MAANVRQLGGGPLMRPRRVHAALGERGDDRRTCPVRPVDGVPRRGRQIGDVTQGLFTGCDAGKCGPEQLTAEIRRHPTHPSSRPVHSATPINPTTCAPQSVPGAVNMVD